MHNIYFVKTSGLEDGKESIVHETTKSIVHETCIALIDQMFKSAVYLTNNQHLNLPPHIVWPNEFCLNEFLRKFLSLERNMVQNHTFRDIIAKVKTGAVENKLYDMLQAREQSTQEETDKKQKEINKKRYDLELKILEDSISNWVQVVHNSTFTNFVVTLICLFVEQKKINFQGMLQWKSNSSSQQLSRDAKTRLQQLFLEKNLNESQRQDIVKHLFTDTDDQWFADLVGLRRILDV